MNMCRCSSIPSRSYPERYNVELKKCVRDREKMRRLYLIYRTDFELCRLIKEKIAILAQKEYKDYLVSI